MILQIDHIPTEKELVQLQEEFKGYIKLVADIDKKVLFGGCRLHHDCEQMLLSSGSLQDNIWGGGVDLESQKIDFNAVANIRPDTNPGTEILDPVKRKIFYNIVKQYFPNYD